MKKPKKSPAPLDGSERARLVCRQLASFEPFHDMHAVLFHAFSRLPGARYDLAPGAPLPPESPAAVLALRTAPSGGCLQARGPADDDFQRVSRGMDRALSAGSAGPRRRCGAV